MADINLLQNQLKDTTIISARRTKLVVWLCLVLLILVGGAGGALYYFTNKTNTQTTDLTNANNELQAQLDSQQQGLQSAQAYQAQLSNIGLLLKNHISFSPLIDELGKYTYQKAAYTSFDVEETTGKIHVEGLTDSYAGLGKLLLGLSTSPSFHDVKLLALSQGSGTQSGIIFSLDMFVIPGVFKSVQQ